MPALTVQQVRTLFVWDKRTLRYRNSVTGRLVKIRDIRRVLVEVADAAQRRIVTLARQLGAGELGVPQWQAATEAAVKELHLAATAAGKGGFASMTQRDYGLAGARLRFHYERLDVFARMVEDGRLSSGAIVARAQLYAAAGLGVYENSRREAARGVMTQERRILGAAEHCGVCVEEDAKGWVEIGTLRRIGDSPCKANCKCRFAFRTEQEN
jgi:hypothetical protein